MMRTHSVLAVLSAISLTSGLPTEWENNALEPVGGNTHVSMERKFFTKFSGFIDMTILELLNDPCSTAPFTTFSVSAVLSASTAVLNEHLQHFGLDCETTVGKVHVDIKMNTTDNHMASQPAPQPLSLQPSGLTPAPCRSRVPPTCSSA